MRVVDEGGVADEQGLESCDRYLAGSLATGLVGGSRRASAELPVAGALLEIAGAPLEIAGAPLEIAGAPLQIRREHAHGPALPPTPRLPAPAVARPATRAKSRGEFSEDCPHLGACDVQCEESGVSVGDLGEAGEVKGRWRGVRGVKEGGSG